MKYLKLYETKRSEDAIKKFKELAKKDFIESKLFYENSFLSSDLPYEFQEEFKLLSFMYIDFDDEQLEKSKKKYIKRIVKKEIQKSLISKMSSDNRLIIKLEQNQYIQELQNNDWYLGLHKKYIFMAFVTALRNLPPRIRAAKKFKI